MDSDRQVVSIGLDFDEREFMQFLDDQVVASYREGYAAGRKVEKDKRRIFWAKVKKEACFWLGAAIFGFVVAMFLIWATR